MTLRADLDRVAALAARAEAARDVLAAGIVAGVDDGRVDLPGAHLTPNAKRPPATVTSYVRT